LKIKTIENAPRDPNKLERLLRLKQRQEEEAMHMEETQKKFSYRREIEMLRLYFVFCVQK